MKLLLKGLIKDYCFTS